MQLLEDRSVKIVPASPELARFIEELVTSHMSQSLLSSGVDLGDMAAVEDILKTENFGWISIARLMREAIKSAKLSALSYGDAVLVQEMAKTLTALKIDIADNIAVVAGLQADGWRKSDVKRLAARSVELLQDH